MCRNPASIYLHISASPNRAVKKYRTITQASESRARPYGARRFYERWLSLERGDMPAPSRRFASAAVASASTAATFFPPAFPDTCWITKPRKRCASAARAERSRAAPKTAEHARRGTADAVPTGSPRRARYQARKRARKRAAAPGISPVRSRFRKSRGSMRSP